MTAKRKGQPPKERKKHSHGMRMYDDDHELAIKEHGSLQKFVDWATGEMKDNLNFRVCPECLNVKSYCSC